MQLVSWVGWFCSLKGNEFFCEVDEDYIQDDFNLSGLPSQVPYYDYALELILDAEAAQEEILTAAQHSAVEAAAEALYGLIHARYILSARGLAAMAEKFRSCDFGRCPRVLCNGQPCLPVGLSDIPRQSTVKLFCPRCNEAYYPRSKHHGNIDGAYFGTTFPHLFLLTYPQYRPQKSPEKYVPKVFGFKISPLAYQKGGGTPIKNITREKLQANVETKKDTNIAPVCKGNDILRQEEDVESMQCEQQQDVSVNGDVSKADENHGSIRKVSSSIVETMSGKKSKT